MRLIRGSRRAVGVPILMTAQGSIPTSSSVARGGLLLGEARMANSPANRAHAVGNAGRVLYRELVTATTVAADTEIFDVVGAPKLRPDLEAHARPVKSHKL